WVGRLSGRISPVHRTPRASAAGPRAFHRLPVLTGALASTIVGSQPASRATPRAAVCLLYWSPASAARAIAAIPARTAMSMHPDAGPDTVRLTPLGLHPAHYERRGGALVRGPARHRGEARKPSSVECSHVRLPGIQ